MSPIGRESLRVRDTLRFLVLGGAYRRRFAARAARYGIVFSSRRRSARPPLAAAAALAILLAIVWAGAQLRATRDRNQTLAADLNALRREIALRQTAPAPAAALPEPPKTAAPPRVNLDRARDELDRARAAARDLDAQLQAARAEFDALRSQTAASRAAEAGISDQLRANEQRLAVMSAELKQLQTGRSEDTNIIASQKLRLRDLTEQRRASSETIDRERKLLVADLDIRELMGARSLHIVDVFDVDGKGKTQRPFGRIFYTQGKSLLFYAFDLKSGGTFQAWGQQDSRDESAQSLGIFYVDDQKQNRWVLKFEDPKVLAEINAVFVTVEPPGGSSRPNRQKMLYAYLNATPNHP